MLKRRGTTVSAWGHDPAEVSSGIFGTITSSLSSIWISFHNYVIFRVGGCYMVSKIFRVLFFVFCILPGCYRVFSLVARWLLTGWPKSKESTLKLLWYSGLVNIHPVLSSFMLVAQTVQGLQNETKQNETKWNKTKNRWFAGLLKIK